ncbi:hypothetical protein Back11_23720 [Paenibacillus baekrokdamisoli]|uniref:Uncharacterized protein n=2 Tax=Paenibacillus baekrokdamisoli TaxID=1712516 RepID=A0A3G9IQ81_9BACL|nr:hypothetical protein [Paenibacillus baekrokdamisoli]BBH21027.1 hypothetical protein Back11_23720 [Paenibacillus baekrokdamisoli]
MKWTGFLIGSLAGVAAAVYVAKKRPGMFAWASSSAGEVWTGMRGKAFNAVINHKFDHETKEKTAKQTGSSKDQSNDSWGQIEMLVNSDPSVKREAEQIVSETKSH